MVGEQVLAGRWCLLLGGGGAVDVGAGVLPAIYRFVVACCDFHMSCHNSEAGVVLHQ